MDNIENIEMIKQKKTNIFEILIMCALFIFSFGSICCFLLNSKVFVCYITNIIMFLTLIFSLFKNNLKKLFIFLCFLLPLYNILLVVLYPNNFQTLNASILLFIILVINILITKKCNKTIFIIFSIFLLVLANFSLIFGFVNNNYKIFFVLSFIVNFFVFLFPLIYSKVHKLQISNFHFLAILLILSFLIFTLVVILAINKFNQSFNVLPVIVSVVMIMIIIFCYEMVNEFFY